MQKKITLQDVAEATGVSVITASRALRGIGRVKPETRARIMKEARSLGYSRGDGLIFPTAAPMRNSEHALKILLPVFPRPGLANSNAFKVTRIITSLKQLLETSGGTLSIVEARDPEELLKNMPRSKQHGVILRQMLPEAWTRQLQQIAPVVYAISHDVVPGTDCVEFNENKSATMIYDHLLSRGHRNILWVSRDRMLPETNVEFSHYNPLSGFDRQAYNMLWIRSSAWAGLDLGTRDELSINQYLTVRKNYPSDDISDARKTARRILGLKKRPTAIVTTTEGDAYFISCELEKAGLRMPEDMSFVTYMEDVPSLPHGINFTCISMPYEQVGQMILEIIQRRISAPHAPYITISIETKLKHGETVADLRPL